MRVRVICNHTVFALSSEPFTSACADLRAGETPRELKFAARYDFFSRNAMIFSSIAIGVGSAVTSTVVRVGLGLPEPAKASA